MLQGWGNNLRTCRSQGTCLKDQGMWPRHLPWGKVSLGGVHVHVCGHEKYVCVFNPLRVPTGLRKAIWGQHLCTSMYACMYVHTGYSCLLQILTEAHSNTNRSGSLGVCTHVSMCMSHV